MMQRPRIRRTTPRAPCGIAVPQREYELTAIHTGAAPLPEAIARL